MKNNKKQGEMIVLADSISDKVINQGDIGLEDVIIEIKPETGQVIHEQKIMESIDMSVFAYDLVLNSGFCCP